MTEDIEVQETDIPEGDSELVPADRRSSLVSTLKGVPFSIASWFSRRARSIVSFFGRGLNRARGFFRDPKTITRDWASRTRSRVVEGAKRTRRELDRVTVIQLIAVVGIFMLFLIAPLFSVTVYAFTNSAGAFSLDYFAALFRDPTIWPFIFNNVTGNWDVYLNFNGGAYSSALNAVAIWGWDFGAIFNSIYIAIIVTIIRTLLIFPILAIPFVGAIGIKEFLALDGFINKLFYETLHILPSAVVLQGIAAMIFVQSLSLFSLVYLNAYSSFMSIDPSLEEQAENLGATGFKLFRSVTLPLAMPGIQAGAILTFILSIEDLGSPIVFQDHATARNTLSFKIYQAVASQVGVVGGEGPAIGIVLLVFALVGFIAIRKYTALRSYDSGTKGGQWNPRTRRLSKKVQVFLYCILVPVLFLALIPQISVIMIALAGSWQPQNLLPDTWTLSNFEVLWAFPDVANSINITLLYGIAATLLIVLLGASAAYIIARKNIPGKGALDLLVTVPIALPGIVIATGYFTLFYNTPIFPIGHPAFLIMMSYTVRKFPFTVRAAYAGLMSTPVVLEEASQNVGASKNRTFLKITLPLIGVSVLAGALLSFVYSVSEVSTSLLLGSVGHSEAPLTYWTSRVLSMIGQWGGSTSAAVLGVLLMIVQWIVIALTNKILGARSAAITGI
ncbi:MAG: ABC transporter permease [Candidatus Thorarchaeota archaeon]|jgi:ABC-type Fe3+ transport system permease subunit